jgi:hypothetical protein
MSTEPRGYARGEHAARNKVKAKGFLLIAEGGQTTHMKCSQIFILSTCNARCPLMTPAVRHILIVVSRLLGQSFIRCRVSLPRPYELAPKAFSLRSRLGKRSHDRSFHYSLITSGGHGTLRLSPCGSSSHIYSQRQQAAVLSHRAMHPIKTEPRRSRVYEPQPRDHNLIWFVACNDVRLGVITAPQTINVT